MKVVCCPYAQGGLQIINFQVWNKVLLLKCLWNLCRKEENLWIKWMHNYYFYRNGVMNYEVKTQNCWISKSILKQRNLIPGLQQQWDNSMTQQKFTMRTFYNGLIDDGNHATWRNIIWKNKSRPKEAIYLWLACHKRLATKERLTQLGLMHDIIRCLCKKEDGTLDHLFFQCEATEPIWRKILDWLEIRHIPLNGSNELMQATEFTKRKGWRATCLKMALAETLYNIWKMMNNICFKNKVNTYCIEDSIKDCIVYRGWLYRKYISHLAKMMIQTF